MTDAASPSEVSSATLTQRSQLSSDFTSQLGQWLENSNKIVTILPVVLELGLYLLNILDRANSAPVEDGGDRNSGSEGNLGNG